MLPTRLEEQNGRLSKMTQLRAHVVPQSSNNPITLYSCFSVPKSMMIDLTQLVSLSRAEADNPNITDILYKDKPFCLLQTLVRA